MLSKQDFTRMGQELIKNCEIWGESAQNMNGWISSDVNGIGTDAEERQKATAFYATQSRFAQMSFIYHMSLKNIEWANEALGSMDSLRDYASTNVRALQQAEAQARRDEIDLLGQEPDGA